jgi:hypothetical protein
MLILGPAAVGKMTVGQALAASTGYELMYNHRVVDLVTSVFPFGTPPFHKLARAFTAQMLDTAAVEGVRLIVTHAMVLSHPTARELVDSFASPFIARGGDVYFAELSAPLAVRLQRNETENRRRHKDVSWATPERLTEMEGWGRWNSNSDFPYPEQHFVLDNTTLSPEEAAESIKARFRL